MGQAVDRRLTVVIDVAFLGLALFLFGRLVRAVEAIDLAIALGILAFVLALWLVVALATGQLRRLNGRTQDRYDRALRRWRALLYCADCAHAFRADGPGYLAPQAVPTYLEHDGPDTLPATTGRAGR